MATDSGLLSLLMGQEETKSGCVCMGTRGQRWEEDKEVLRQGSS